MFKFLDSHREISLFGDLIHGGKCSYFSNVCDLPHLKYPQCVWAGCVLESALVMRVVTS